MRRLNRVCGDYEMRGEIVEGIGRVGQLSIVPVVKGIGVGARSNKPSLGICFSHCLAEGFRSLRYTRQSGVADLEISPQFIAEFPQQAAGEVCPMSVYILHPVGRLL